MSDEDGEKIRSGGEEDLYPFTTLLSKVSLCDGGTIHPFA